MSLFLPQLYLLWFIAQATIDLMGLDRAPHLSNTPTVADTRWRSRIEAWDKAKRSLSNWNKNPSTEMAQAIAMTAKNGHYSIWCTVFNEHPQVIQAIITEYNGTYTETNTHGMRVVRSNGII